jgi:hypothetical protein
MMLMPAAQAVIGHRQEAVGVGGEIDADGVSFFVDGVVDEARVLMRQAIVILSPHVGSEEVVEGGQLSAPGQAACGLEPLGVLVEHRVDDMNECFVTGEQTMPTGE